MNGLLTILTGDALEQLRTLPDESVHCCVTSPPYWGLRDYGTGTWEGGSAECDHKSGRFERGGLSTKQASNNGSGGDEARGDCPKCGARRVDRQIGLERTPEEYVAKMVEVFREVRRVLRSDGTCWMNLGDSYATPKVGNTLPAGFEGDRQHQPNRVNGDSWRKELPPGLKPKDLCGIPWRVAFALQADGWWLRSDIIWCLSGGTWLYVQTDKSGECLMTVKDLYRLKPSWVRLWNGSHWTGLLGVSKSPRKGDEIELVLRSGERISCTPTHKFPTSRGLLEASKIQVGDTLTRCKLPEPYPVKDCALDRDAAWFAGLYLAEGSRSGDKIQIAGHTKEDSRWKQLQHIAAKYGGTCAKFVDGNSTSIVLYGKILNAIVDEFVSGRTAHDKGFAPSVWRYSNEFVEAMLRGYLSGDGHFDATNNRWRLGFCRNYNLERDLRTACARLGFRLVLNLSSVSYNGKPVPTFRGEIRETRTGHHNQKDSAEVVEIRKARCREVYDLGVANEPNLFALASGILTHNSKPNPMPESVTDRPTKAHEYLFLLAKSERYYYDAEAIKEPSIDPESLRPEGRNPRKDDKFSKAFLDENRNGFARIRDGFSKLEGICYPNRNRRSVWTVPTAPYSEAHFATFPPDLIKPCILAGCPAGGTVLDPFLGSGTTGMVALELGRKCIGIELNPEYVKLAQDRCNVTPGFSFVTEPREKAQP